MYQLLKSTKKHLIHSNMYHSSFTKCTQQFDLVIQRIKRRKLKLKRLIRRWRRLKYNSYTHYHIQIPSNKYTAYYLRYCSAYACNMNFNWSTTFLTSCMYHHNQQSKAITQLLANISHLQSSHLSLPIDQNPLGWSTKITALTTV